MCGILVLTSSKLEESRLNQSSLQLQKRGPDMALTQPCGVGTFCFHRLAIMDLNPTGMQPFEHHGNMLVANAEIFNYHQLHQKYIPEYIPFSHSDCEVLLPLYDVLKEQLFAHLDAEFAIVLYDKNLNQYIAARDPIGIRPMFYGYEKETKAIAFASEVKGLIDLVDHVYPFPPGHYYKNGTFTRYTSLYDIPHYHQDGLNQVTMHIREKLTEGVIKRLDSDADMAFLLSGGLDSSLVCSIAARFLKKPIKTFAIGMDKDAIDLKYAKQVADYLHCDHTEVIMTKEQVLSHLKEVIYALETYDITTIRASMGMYLITKYIHEHTHVKVLLTGEVSDELFGYKYTDYAPSPEAFQEEALKRVRELHQYDVLRADRCLAANSLEARVPFADIDFMSYVLRIDPKLKVNTTGTGKFLLRKAFEGDYLPYSILYREKAAFSDAVGHSMVDDLKEFANHYYSDEEFQTKKKNYPVNTPISKESLLYRDIFESYYPGHADLIPSFWMPNPKWDNCNVNDPSARVLKNYGESGK